MYKKKRWKQYGKIDTDATNKHVLSVLQEEHIFINKFFINVRAKQDTIRYTIHENKFKLREEFGPIFTAVQRLNRKFVEAK